MRTRNALAISLLALGAMSPVACVQKRVDACRESCQCKTLGRCAESPSAVQDCAPATDADCKESVACRDAGHCKRSGLECVIGSEDDCKASKVCLTLGACTFAEGRCINTSPPPEHTVLHGVIRH